MKPQKPLTDRETECIDLIALGYSTVQITARLELAYDTVKKYITQAHRKLSTQSRTELVAWRWGTLDKCITVRPIYLEANHLEKCETHAQEHTEFPSTLLSAPSLNPQHASRLLPHGLLAELDSTL